ncbi:hypothetical protein [Streptomyces sp. NPDC058394]|uniref:5-methylcytosine restriction system specificity protein McrC n=1 Tax=Streptomyces sp. NPDC058394 TaxID=3346477 RepID=UPI0036630EDA
MNQEEVSPSSTEEVLLREHGPAVSVPLDSETGRALSASGILRSATPDPGRSGHWLLRAGSSVGAVRIPGGRVLRITPKTSVSRLFFLLGFSLDPARAWRDSREGTIDTGGYEDVVPALAHAVERQIDAALRQGVLQGYRTVEESALFVRGRIREADQVRRYFGRTPVAVVDAKYKVEKADGLLNADLYQALAYATVLGLDEAHLVYAAGREPVRVHEVHGAGIRLFQHSLDLSRPPEGLLSVLDGVARQLAGAPPNP